MFNKSVQTTLKFIIIYFENIIIIYFESLFTFKVYFENHHHLFWKCTFFHTKLWLNICPILNPSSHFWILRDWETSQDRDISQDHRDISQDYQDISQDHTILCEFSPCPSLVPSPPTLYSHHLNFSAGQCSIILTFMLKISKPFQSAMPY